MCFFVWLTNRRLSLEGEPQMLDRYKCQLYLDLIFTAKQESISLWSVKISFRYFVVVPRLWYKISLHILSKNPLYLIASTWGFTSFGSSSYIWVWCAHVCTCVHAYMCMWRSELWIFFSCLSMVCMCMWRSEVDIWSLPQLLSAWLWGKSLLRKLV